ncbi:hypothetical protein [Extibacter muris]|uniref:hypothetical protein n=1 Tax=Extibacter muris TaxID=1796622 RepID=UPI001D0836E1|nr:hypothetical protein [Extibacter muris]MCB6202762.1 hypothetical protein [Extibacter muris]MCQ4664442.1 hypothetical protein [Extibacter muris]MCQ4693651.1 hypothetical protein [Extibacter muris]
MKDIICPGCKRKIPSYEVECLFCGFPLQKYLQDNSIDDLDKKILCTRCGNAGNGLMGPVTVKCEYCNIPMVQTRYGIREFAVKYNESLEGVQEKIMESMGINEREYKNMTLQRDPRILAEVERIKGGNPYALFLKEQFPDDFDMAAFEGRELQAKQEAEQKQKEAEARLPRCPRCGSTDIRKWYAPINVNNGVYVKRLSCNKCGKTWMS